MEWPLVTATLSLPLIFSLLPDPVGSDRDLEEVTLRSNHTAAIDMTGWLLRDESGRVWSLSSMGTIEPDATRTIRRGGMAMSLDNDGDRIQLISPTGVVSDELVYSAVAAGVLVQP